VKPPFTYFGGKLSIADRIADMLPPHEHYIEPFAGSLAVLLAKRPSRIETANDLDGRLVNFWRVLRDRPADLERACFLTPHSRAELGASDDLTVVDDLERARRVWVALTQGRGGSLRPGRGWRHYADPAGTGSSFPTYLATYAGRLAPAAAMLRNVSLECRPALDVIAAYGAHDGNLIYADPPYEASTRAQQRNDYVVEMRGEDEHRELAEALRACRAAVVLSGYGSPLYEGLYDGWYRAEINATADNGAADKRARTEVLWSNRPFPVQMDLFTEEAS
jgi:DNA adenine methylase